MHDGNQARAFVVHRLRHNRERYAAEIDVRPWNALYERPTTMSLLPDVTGRDVLDAGCGGGWYSEQLAGRGARVTAIDRSARMVAITKERLAGRMRVIEADVTDLREVFADMSFDVVLCSLVLHYVTDLTAAFSECARVLRREVGAGGRHHPRGWKIDTDNSNFAALQFSYQALPIAFR